MKIYCQYSTQKILRPGKGDLTTEIGLYTALSQFADVFYGGTLFQPHLPDYGLHEYPGLIESRIPKDCDAYYIRANESVFRHVPAGKPKLWVCSPWNEYCFRHATKIATLTEAWEKALRAGTQIPILNPKGLSFQNVTTIHQVVSSTFKPLQGARKTVQIRRKVGGGFIIGLFGRVTESNYPHALLTVAPWLVKKFPQVRFIVGVTKGDFPKGLPNVTFMNFVHSDMPFATSACDLIFIPGKGFTWPVRGSVRALEAGACGVPILLATSAARAEHLGEGYSLFLPEPHPTKSADNDVEALKRAFRKVIRSDSLRKMLATKLPRWTRFYQVKQSGARLRETFERLVSGEGKV